MYLFIGKYYPDVIHLKSENNCVCGMHWEGKGYLE